MSSLIKLRDAVAKEADTDSQKIGVDVVSRVLSITGKYFAELSSSELMVTITEMMRSGDTPTSKAKRGRPTKAKTAAPKKVAKAKTSATKKVAKKKKKAA